MTAQYSNEPMLEMFIFETTQLLEQLEQLILASEQSKSYTQPAIDEIFRIMHTIKGSSAMMMFDNISSLTHSIEDLFYLLRGDKPLAIDCSALSDLIFEGLDFIKVELEKIKNGDNADGSAAVLIDNIKDFLDSLRQEGTTAASEDQAVDSRAGKQQFYISPDRQKSIVKCNCFKAVIYFEDGCQMENIRAFSVIHNLKNIAEEISYIPEDIIDNDECIETIRRDGFTVFLKCSCAYDEISRLLSQALFLKDLELVQLEDDALFRSKAGEDEMNNSRRGGAESRAGKSSDITGGVGGTGFREYKADSSRQDRDSREKTSENRDLQSISVKQSIISVSVTKLDTLMDLVGEMVIAEAMVVQNPDLKGLALRNFHKSARQLHKITGEIQDIVMSVRMVPVAATFHKMNRIIRDMSRKLGKEINLKLIGEETEVDKNIIEHISDPIMHLIRNSIDHGIGSAEERLAAGKPQTGTVTLEARNAGSDVLVIVSDDGKGLDRGKILKKAREAGLLSKPENEMSDREIYNLVFLPGFSTSNAVSEFSGRGVGMDVVVKNISTLGGSVSVDSLAGAGTTVTLKIPLTLAIIDGMNVKVGNSCYTIPIISIKESFRPKESDIISDPDGNEMIMVRGECYPIIRLHEYFGVTSDIREFTNGILVMLETDTEVFCVFADELAGQQQVVVKALPEYLKTKKIRGVAGCTLLGDGSISLILDIAGLVSGMKLRKAVV